MQQAASNFNLFDPSFLRNPFPILAQLRESAPVYWFEPAQSFFLTRYADVAAALKDTARYSSARTQSIIASQVPASEYARYAPLASALANWMVLQDPPAHTRSRALVAKAFTPRVIEQMRPAISAVVDELVDRIQGAGRADLVTDFAEGVPIAVIAQMLGVPKSDWALLKTWTDEFADFVGMSGQPDAPQRGMHGAVAICDYFLALIAERRHHPKADLVGALMAAASDTQHPLSDQEVASSCFLLMSAGHETAETLIGSTAYLLLRHPEQRQKLHADPSLLAGAIEEGLRYEPPLFMQGRILSQDTELHGHTLKKGQMVLLSLAAANRDPAVFADPECFDITRRENPHLSFAVGPHHCLGANLARLEANLALGTLLRRLPALRLEQEAADLKPPNLMMHQLQSLRVSF